MTVRLRPSKAVVSGLPTALAPLITRAHWVVWRWELNGQKWAKVPYQPRRPQAKASSDDKSTWSDYDTALRVLATHNDVDGVGFCLFDSDVAALDLDDCRNPQTGEIAPWARSLVNRAASYTEVTVSGTGLRIIGLGTGPEKHRKQPVEDGGSLETYRRAKRYIVMTGDVFNAHGLENIDKTIDEVVSELDAKKKKPTSPVPSSTKGLPCDLAALLYIPDAGAGVPTGGYPSRSELLFGFINRALRAGVNDEAIVAACLDAQYAGKAIYEHVQDNGGETYIGRQIEHALNDVGDTPDAGKVLLRVEQGYRHETWRAVARALHKANCPVYVRGGALVEPLWRWEKGDDANCGTLVAKFARYNLWRLSDMVARHAVIFQKFNSQKHWATIDPPKDVIETLLYRGDWDFPTVRGIVNSPTMRPDGSLLTTPGYDVATQLWYKPAGDLELPPIPERPTKTEAEAALKLLTNLLAGFPFETDVDRSVALAASLTVVLRGAFEIAPLFLLLAPESGTGKTYLVFVISTIATGRRAVPIPATDETKEMQKRLEAAAMEAKPILFLNNLSFDLESDLICQMVTDGTIDIRPFFRNDELIPCDCRGTTVFVNGNNIRVVGDLVRRTLTCHINAKMERPETRKWDFDPIDKVRANRGAYLAAAFTIVRAYMAAGSPRVDDVEAFAGFDAWSRMVRFPLMWLGCEDPVRSTEEARMLDPKRQGVRERISAYVKYMGVGNPFAAAALVKKALETTSGPFGYPTPAHQDLFDALSRDGRNVNPKAVGHQLMNDRERVCRVDGVDYRLVLVTSDPKTANTYKVENVVSPESVVMPEEEAM